MNHSLFQLTLGLTHTENIGLIRIDYNAAHKNPERITEDVPEYLHRFAGVRFPNNESHIHIYVQNFNLDWAMPLKEHSFEVKIIESISDIEKAIRCFQREINLKTSLMIQMSSV